MSNWWLPVPVKSQDLERVARRLGFQKVRQKGGHGRWKHPDGRATTIPVHSDAEIGAWLFHTSLRQLDISEEEFRRLL